MGAARDLIEQSLELYNRGDLDRLLSTYAVNALEITPDGPNNGRKAIGQRLRAEHNAYPDRVVKPIFVVEEGSRVVVEYSWSGTHTGVLVFAEGVARAPTGQSLSVAAVSIFHLRNGQIQAHRMYLDRLPPSIPSSQIFLDQSVAPVSPAPS